MCLSLLYFFMTYIHFTSSFKFSYFPGCWFLPSCTCWPFLPVVCLPVWCTKLNILWVHLPWEMSILWKPYELHWKCRHGAVRAYFCLWWSWTSSWAFACLFYLNLTIAHVWMLQVWGLNFYFFQKCTSSTMCLERDGWHLLKQSLRCW